MIYIYAASKSDSGVDYIYLDYIKTFLPKSSFEMWSQWKYSLATLIIPI